MTVSGYASCARLFRSRTLNQPTSQWRPCRSTYGTQQRFTVKQRWCAGCRQLAAVQVSKTPFRNQTKSELTVADSTLSLPTSNCFINPPPPHCTPTLSLSTLRAPPPRPSLGDHLDCLISKALLVLCLGAFKEHHAPARYTYQVLASLRFGSGLSRTGGTRGVHAVPAEVVLFATRAVHPHLALSRLSQSAGNPSVHKTRHTSLIQQGN